MPEEHDRQQQQQQDTDNQAFHWLDPASSSDDDDDSQGATNSSSSSDGGGVGRAGRRSARRQRALPRSMRRGASGAAVPSRATPTRQPSTPPRLFALDEAGVGLLQAPSEGAFDYYEDGASSDSAADDSADDSDSDNGTTRGTLVVELPSSSSMREAKFPSIDSMVCLTPPDSPLVVDYIPSDDDDDDAAAAAAFELAAMLHGSSGSDRPLGSSSSSRSPLQGLQHAGTTTASTSTSADANVPSNDLSSLWHPEALDPRP